MLGKRAKKNRIIKHLEQNLETKEYEVIEDRLSEEDPTIKIQTKDRIVTLFVNAEDLVEEDFRMRRGAGSKSDFIKKQDAFREIEAFIHKTYKKTDEITKKSFDESQMKVRTEDKNITITYDFTQKEIIVKERARKKATPAVQNITPAEDSPTKSAKKDVVQKKTQKKQSSVVKDASPVVKTVQKMPYERESDPDLLAIINPKKKKREPFVEGMKVRTLYNDGIFTVVEDRGDVVVISENQCSYIVAASDLVPIKRKGSL